MHIYDPYFSKNTIDIFNHAQMPQRYSGDWHARSLNSHHMNIRENFKIP